jgi:uncharacterized membrane protein
MTVVERVVSRILWWGGVVSISLMLFGLAGYALRVGIGSASFDLARTVENRQAGRPPEVFTSLPQVLDGFRHRPIDPLAIAAVGMLTLLATPVAAVIVAIPLFLGEGDRRYGLIATLLAVALIGSLLIGGSG